MANDLMRFSVAMPEDLLVSFDRLVSRRGLAKNRSEVVRDLVRDALVEDECAMPGVEVAGSLTIVFDLVTAIAVGMLITVVLFMKMVSEETEVKGWQYYCDADSEVTHLRELPKSVRVYEINGPMFFGMTDRISDISVKDFTHYLIIRIMSSQSVK